MADKAISELTAATQVNANDLFVLQQSGTAKKLTGQILENWLVSFADGHGGIQSISDPSTSGLTDTYTITFADTTTSTFTVKNGRGITSIVNAGKSGLTTTYTINYNDGTTTTIKVTDGAKGDKGNNAYVHIRYAAVNPTSNADVGTTPNAWMGIYNGTSSTAPTSYTSYTWYEIKGVKGDTGDAATLTSNTTLYQVSDSGTIIPTGAWLTNIPTVPQGKYLWVMTTLNFNTGNPIVSYSVSRMGVDGTGSVKSVNNASPDGDGNVTLNASNVGALPTTGGIMTGVVTFNSGRLNMNGQVLTGLNTPSSDTEAASKEYVDTHICNPNLLDNWYFVNPVNQRGATSYGGNAYTIDRWLASGGVSEVTVNDGFISAKFKTAGGAVDQILPLEMFQKGETLTLSALMKCTNGTVSIQANTGSAYTTVSTLSQSDSYELVTLTFTIADAATANPRVRFRSGGVDSALDIIAIKLELGDTQTLAHQVNGAWMLNEIPNYAEQLAKCQRYFYRVTNSATAYGAGYGYVPNSTTSAVIWLPVPVSMRGKPTIGGSAGVTTRCGGGLQNPTLSSVFAVGPGTVGLTVNGDYTGLQYTSLSWYVSSGALELSCDL